MNQPESQVIQPDDNETQINLAGAMDESIYKQIRQDLERQKVRKAALQLTNNKKVVMSVDTRIPTTNNIQTIEAQPPQSLNLNGLSLKSESLAGLPEGSVPGLKNLVQVLLHFREKYKKYFTSTQQNKKHVKNAQQHCFYSFDEINLPTAKKLFPNGDTPLAWGEANSITLCCLGAIQIPPQSSYSPEPVLVSIALPTPLFIRILQPYLESDNIHLVFHQLLKQNSDIFFHDDPSLLEVRPIEEKNNLRKPIKSYSASKLLQKPSSNSNQIPALTELPPPDEETTNKITKLFSPDTVMYAEGKFPEEFELPGIDKYSPLLAGSYETLPINPSWLVEQKESGGLPFLKRKVLVSGAETKDELQKKRFLGITYKTKLVETEIPAKYRYETLCPSALALYKKINDLEQSANRHDPIAFNRWYFSVDDVNPESLTGLLVEGTLKKTIGTQAQEVSVKFGPESDALKAVFICFYQVPNEYVETEQRSNFATPLSLSLILPKTEYESVLKPLLTKANIAHLVAALLHGFVRFRQGKEFLKAPEKEKPGIVLHVPKELVQIEAE